MEFFVFFGKGILVMLFALFTVSIALDLAVKKIRVVAQESIDYYMACNTKMFEKMAQQQPARHAVSGSGSSHIV